MEPNEVKQEVAVLAEQAAAVEIQNDSDYEVAGAFLVQCAKQLKRIDEVFDPIIKAAHAAHKEAVAKKKEVAGPVDEAKLKVSGLIGTYDRKKAEERRRVEDEERERLRKIEEEKRLAEAEELEKSGRAEEAEALVSKPIHVAPPPAPKPVRPHGVSVRNTWDYRITNPLKIKPEYMKPDEVKIGRVVRAMGEQAGALIGEGVEVYEKSIVSARTA